MNPLLSSDEDVLLIAGPQADAVLLSDERVLSIVASGAQIGPVPVLGLEEQGPGGPPGPQGEPGPAGAAASIATFQILGVASYTAAHGLAYFPRVWIVDSTGAEVETDVLYAPGQVTIVFAYPFNGTLYVG